MPGQATSGSTSPRNSIINNPHQQTAMKLFLQSGVNLQENPWPYTKHSQPGKPEQGSCTKPTPLSHRLSMMDHVRPSTTAAAAACRSDYMPMASSRRQLAIFSARRSVDEAEHRRPMSVRAARRHLRACAAAVDGRPAHRQPVALPAGITTKSGERAEAAPSTTLPLITHPAPEILRAATRHPHTSANRRTIAAAAAASLHSSLMTGLTLSTLTCPLSGASRQRYVIENL